MTPTPEPSKEALKERLKLARLRAGLTQNEVATITGLKPAAISHFETGNRTPSIQNLVKLCEALKITSDEIIGIRPRATPPTVDLKNCLYEHHHWAIEDMGKRYGELDLYRQTEEALGGWTPDHGDQIKKPTVEPGEISTRKEGEPMGDDRHLSAPAESSTLMPGEIAGEVADRIADIIYPTFDDPDSGLMCIDPSARDRFAGKIENIIQAAIDKALSQREICQIVSDEEVAIKAIPERLAGRGGFGAGEAIWLMAEYIKKLKAKL